MGLNGFPLLLLLRFKEGNLSKGFILQMSLGISEYGPQEEIIWGSCLLEMQVRREQNLEGEKVLGAEFLKCIICLGPSLGEILGPPGMTTLKPQHFDCELPKNSPNPPPEAASTVYNVLRKGKCFPSLL